MRPTFSRLSLGVVSKAERLHSRFHPRAYLISLQNVSRQSRWMIADIWLGLLFHGVLVTLVMHQRFNDDLAPLGLFQASVLRCRFGYMVRDAAASPSMRYLARTMRLQV